MDVRASSTSSISTQIHTVATLVTPHLLALKNRWSSRHGLPRKELLSCLFVMLMMVGLYGCCASMLRELSLATPDYRAAHATIMSALAFAMFIMIFLSACVSAMSALYVSKDMDFLLSAPVSKTSLLLAKVSETALSIGWMLLIFGVPLYVSFGQALSAGIAYYVGAPIVLATFLAPAILLGTAAAILFSSLLPARGGRHAFALLFAVSIGLFFAILNDGAKMLLPSSAPTSTALRFIKANLPWYMLPSSQISRVIEELSRGELRSAAFALMTCASFSYASWLLTLALFTRLFFKTHSKLQVSSSPLQIDSRLGRSIARLLFAMTRRGTRALVTKEVYAFSRELTQTLQLAMLLTICALYSYNFGQIPPPTKVGVEILQLWDVLMTALNMLLGLMVILSISSRFVFPSVSLEGGSLWILQSAPVSTRDILRAKYTAWFSLIFFVALAVFSAGGFAIGIEPRIIAASTLSGIIISHGLVTLGLGFGARFARFDWEHQGQLATNTGNLVYMIAGVLLLGVNMIPVTMMFGAYYLLPMVFRDDVAALMLLMSGVTVLSVINLTIGRVAISIGARALQRGLA